MKWPCTVEWQDIFDPTVNSYGEKAAKQSPVGAESSSNTVTYKGLT